MSDFECLQSYARENSQAAFAALVARHVDLVYSAALRQVRSPELAEEVAQSVFLDLSRHAAKISVDQPLAAWLYVVTRRTAVDVIRREARRQTRERTAAEFAAMKETPPHAWSHVERSLDEAMDTLNDTERSAIVLRFFENHSLREVGVALGISEDTAQKRVSRALDQLRTFFARRGVAVTATGLASELSTHAIQAAPAGLGATISTAAALSGGAGAAATLEATKTIAMTTAHKSLLAALVLVTGAGFYEASVFAGQKADLLTLEQQNVGLAAQLQQARAQQEAAARSLKTVEDQIDLRLAKPADPAAPGDAALEAQIKTWLGNIDRLKQLFEERPNLRIPQIQLLADADWFKIAGGAKLDSEANIRHYLTELRNAAGKTMAGNLSAALTRYTMANDGSLPDQPAQLLPFFDPPIDPIMLDRYKMLRTGKLSDIPAANRSQLMAETETVDIEHDLYWQIGLNGLVSGQSASYNLDQAQRAFSAANHGEKATAAGQLLPYLQWPVDEATLQKLMSRSAGAPAR